MNSQITTEKLFLPTETESAYTNLREDLIHSLDSSIDYRAGFVEEKISSGLAAQIRSIRERLMMNQTEFAKLLGRSQPWVSRLEDPNEPIPTIPTLLSVASKLDIGLKVSFVPFAELVDDMTKLSPDKLSVPAFREDRSLFPRKEPGAITKTNVLMFRAKGSRLHLDEVNAVGVPYRSEPSNREVVNG